MGQYVRVTNEIRSTSRSTSSMNERWESNHDAHNLAWSAIYDSLGWCVWPIDPLKASVISTLRD